MTSTPASRSARATTFAPRSWPSRPGLAMTTRMLLMNPLHRIADRVRPARLAATGRVAAPARPAGGATTRRPASGGRARGLTVPAAGHDGPPVRHADRAGV